MDPSVSAILLAAGASTRMGTLKQLIRIGEKTMLENTIDVLRASRVTEIILVLGHRAKEITGQIAIDRRIKLVINESYKQGMSTSIKCGLGEVSPAATGALIVLADQPFLKPASIDRLIEEHKASDASIFIPVYQGFRGNPVLIGRSLFSEMMQISGDIGCRSLFGLHSQQIRKVPVEDVGILIDLDTAEDLAKAQSLKGEIDPNVIDQSAEKDRYVGRFAGSSKRLVVIGRSDVAEALIRLGIFLKFQVTVVDPLMMPEEAPTDVEVLRKMDLSETAVAAGTSIVVASRGKYDEEALEQALRTPADYVALLCNKKRGTEVLQSLRTTNLSEPDLKRVRFPAGLDINATTPEEIALSVMAEIVSIQNKSIKSNL